MMLQDDLIRCRPPKRGPDIPQRPGPDLPILVHITLGIFIIGIDLHAVNPAQAGGIGSTVNRAIPLAHTGRMVLLIDGIPLTGMDGCGEIVGEPLAHSAHLTPTPTDILSMLQGVAILVEDDV